MTQRRLPSTTATARDVKSVPATVADKQLMGEEHCSLQVAFEELQCHLRQSRDEIARLERAKAKLRAEVEAKNISLGYLQQQLDKRDQETEDLKSKLEEQNQRNTDLAQQLAEAQKANSGGFGPYTLPQSSKKQPFRYPVEVGVQDSDQEDPSVWTLDGMSQLLMARMQQEMKSLEELGGEVIEDLPSSDGSRTPLLSHDQPRRGGTKGADEEDTRQYDSSLQAAMRLIATLTAQLNTAREKVLGQRAALLSTLARLRDCGLFFPFVCQITSPRGKANVPAGQRLADQDPRMKVFVSTSHSSSLQAAPTQKCHKAPYQKRSSRGFVQSVRSSSRGDTLRMTLKVTSWSTFQGIH
ncbi:uncharacterized protein [Dermacentor albipictus]|uniref:uncharacterized protein isoform X1 n=1 Tax=Dermacentor albipictus TaxID=60249 RepID=UPI0031FBEB3D